MSAGQPTDVVPLLAYCFSELSGVFNHLANATQCYSSTGKLPQSMFQKDQIFDHSQPEESRRAEEALTQHDQVAPLCVDIQLPLSGKPKGQKKPKAGRVSAYNRFVREKVQKMREDGVETSDDGEKRDLLKLARQEWNRLAKEVKKYYADKYKAEDAHGEANGEEVKEEGAGGPSLAPSNHPSPAAAGPGSPSDEAAAPGEEAAPRLEGPALQEKRDVPKKVNKQKDKGKQPPEGELSAEDAPAEGTDTKEIAAGTVPAGEAPDEEAPGPDTPPETPPEKKKSKKKNKMKKMKTENQSTQPSDV